MELVQSHNRVLILGGGDGLALREVLKYPNVKNVELVDIDPTIVNLAKTNPNLLELNKGSFLDKRVKVHNVDAKLFIENNDEKYDVIIVDFPDPADSVISSLYTKELFSQLSNLLSNNGMLVCQSSSPEDTPQSYWSIAKTMNSAGLHTLPYNVIVPSFGLWGFHLAANQKFTVNLTNISVPYEALSKNLNSLFKIPSDIKSEKKNAIVNSIDKLKLHEVFQEEISSWY